MGEGPRRQALGLPMTAILAMSVAGPAAADGQTIRIAEQFGIAYLPLHVIRDRAQPAR